MLGGVTWSLGTGAAATQLTLGACARSLRGLAGGVDANLRE